MGICTVLMSCNLSHVIYFFWVSWLLKSLISEITSIYFQLSNRREKNNSQLVLLCNTFWWHWIKNSGNMIINILISTSLLWVCFWLQWKSWWKWTRKSCLVRFFLSSTMVFLALAKKQCKSFYWVTEPLLIRYLWRTSSKLPLRNGAEMAEVVLCWVQMLPLYWLCNTVLAGGKWWRCLLHIKCSSFLLSSVPSFSILLPAKKNIPGRRARMSEVRSSIALLQEEKLQ